MINVNFVGSIFLSGKKDEVFKLVGLNKFFDKDKDKEKDKDKDKERDKDKEKEKEKD